MMQNEKNVTENHGGNMGKHGETWGNQKKLYENMMTYDDRKKNI